MDKYLNNHIVLRIIAVVIACVLWLSINAPAPGSTSAQGATVAKDFPYEVHVNLSSDMMVSNLATSTVVIEIKSSIPDAASLPADMMGVEVVADARGLGPGPHTIPLKAQNMPPVRYSIIPTSITVTLTHKTTASKPVKVEVIGTAATGYQAGSPTTDVRTVEVSGASSAVSRVAAVTAQISVAGAKTTVSHTLTLAPVDKNGKPVAGVEVDPVNVTATVLVLPPEVSLKLVPEVVGNPASGYAVAGLALSPSSIAVSGTQESTNGLTTVTIPVDVQGLSSTQTVSVPVTRSFGWTKVTPDKVDVTVQVEASATRAFNKVQLQLENIPTGTQVTLGKVTSITVGVTGPKSLVSKLTTSDVIAYVDATGLTVRSTEAPVDVHVPQWIRVTQVSEATVPVTVTSNAPSGVDNSTASGNSAGPGNASGSSNSSGQ